jgi:hypothetical protein
MITSNKSVNSSRFAIYHSGAAECAGCSQSLRSGGGYTEDVPRELDPSRFLNRPPESFNPSEWRAVHGLWAAFEIYSSQTAPLHRIRALGASATECMQTVAAEGLDASSFEYVPLRSPLPL